MKTLRSQLPQFSPAVLVLSASIMLTGSLCGCGAQTYEDRIETTKQYYDYIDRLNQNLGPQHSDSGVTVRLPKQFALVPAPVRRPPRPQATPNVAAGENATGTVAAAEPEEIIDPRQPDYLDVELPGLIAAWNANLSTVGSAAGANQPEMHPGSIYLLSNYNLWRTFKTPNETIDPTKFHDEVMRTLTGALGVHIDERVHGSATDRVNKWFSETVPATKDQQFAPRKEIRTITLIPEAREEEEGEESEADQDFPREYQVYLFSNGDLKIVLIYALPKNVSTAEDLQDRILFSLQTLNVSDEKPSGKNPKAPAGTQPKSVAF